MVAELVPCSSFNVHLGLSESNLGSQATKLELEGPTANRR